MQSAILLAVLSVIVAGAVGDPMQDQVSCVSWNETTNSSLVIDCRGVAAGQLAQELDSLLSDEDLASTLRRLTIRKTLLTKVPRSVCRLSRLTHLILDYNRLTQLPDSCFSAMPKLKHLSANNNNITALQDGLFDGLRDLEKLSLTWNQISVIGRAVFTLDAELHNLTFVSLGGNRITTLDPWPAVLGTSRSKENPIYVSFRRNRIANLTNTIRWNYTCQSSPTYFRLGLSHNLLTSLTDMLNGWDVDDTALMCLLSYQRNSPHAYPFLSLGHNPFVCGCKDYRFYEAVNLYFVHTNLFRKVYCDEPTELLRTEVLRVQLIQFKCDVSDRCPLGCRCTYRPRNLTVHVNCPSTNMTELPFHLPPLPKSAATYKLNVSHSRFLRHLEHRDYFTRTSILDVSHSAIEDITFEAWKALVHIREVFLNDNQLTKIPREYSLVNITSKSISLERNPWNCACDRDWMQDWLIATQAHLANPSGMLCRTPKRLSDMSIMKMYKKEFCVDPVKQAVALCMLAVFGSLAVFIALCIGAYCLRVRLHRRWKFHPFDRDECAGERMDYDVFLSCSAEDKETARRLMDAMKQRGYRVFRPEADVTDEVERAVQRSKRTVCLLSKHFIKSQYCLHEFQSAVDHNSKRDKRLVMLTTITNPLELYTSVGSEAVALRRFLRRRKCIDLKSSDWMDRLFYALPVSPLENSSSSNENNAEEEPDEEDEADPGEDVPLIAP